MVTFQTAYMQLCSFGMQPTKVPLGSNGGAAAPPEEKQQFLNGNIYIYIYRSIDGDRYLQQERHTRLYLRKTHLAFQ